MLPYSEFRYLFPPRPENPLPSRVIQLYENKGTYLFQPKLNGDCLEVYLNGKDAPIFYDRHKTIYTKIPANVATQINKLYRETIGATTGKWMVLVGEYMAKSKRDEDGLFNHKFVIHDIIVYDGVQLVGRTTEERIELLDNLYGKDDKVLTENGVKTYKYLYTCGQPDCFRVKSFYKCILALYNDLIIIGGDTPGMYEGLVGKLIKAKLENGITEKNNSSSMVKFSKPTKNYSH